MHGRLQIFSVEAFKFARHGMSVIPADITDAGREKEHHTKAQEEPLADKHVLEHSLTPFSISRLHQAVLRQPAYFLQGLHRWRRSSGMLGFLQMTMGVGPPSLPDLAIQHWRSTFPRRNHATVPEYQEPVQPCH